MKNDISQMFAKGIVSGWMIATMVWMIPSMEHAKIWIILLITYLMALGDFTHIVVVQSRCLIWSGPATRLAQFLAAIRLAYPGRQYYWWQLDLRPDQPCSGTQ